MRISKALKKLTKIKGEMSELRSRIGKSNVALEDNEFEENIDDLWKQYLEKRDVMIGIKQKIMKANIENGIFGKILLMAEKKAEAAMLRDLEIKEGKHTSGGFHSDTIHTYRCQINRTEQHKRIKDLDFEIESIRDELDDFNSDTNI